MYINNLFPDIYFMQTLTQISILKCLSFLIQHKLTTQISASIKLIHCDILEGTIMHLYWMFCTLTQSELCDRLNEECPSSLGCPCVGWIEREQRGVWSVKVSAKIPWQLKKKKAQLAPKAQELHQKGDRKRRKIKNMWRCKAH